MSAPASSPARPPLTRSLQRVWTATGRLLATGAGLVIVWMAVTMLIGDSLIRPSATSDGEPALVVTATWYGEVMRYLSSGLLGFLGVTLAIAPWRRRPARPRVADASTAAQD